MIRVDVRRKDNSTSDTTGDQKHVSTSTGKSSPPWITTGRQCSPGQ